VIVVHAIMKPSAGSNGSATATVGRQLLEPSEPQTPPTAIWIDLVEPTVEEDRKVQEFVGVPVPTKVDPDYTEPPEAHYSENGVHYLHALFISEPEDTPDVTGVTRQAKSIRTLVIIPDLPHPAGRNQIYSDTLDALGREDEKMWGALC
jgi:hypothetical protein